MMSEDWGTDATTVGTPMGNPYSDGNPEIHHNREVCTQRELVAYRIKVLVRKARELIHGHRRVQIRGQHGKKVNMEKDFQALILERVFQHMGMARVMAKVSGIITIQHQRRNFYHYGTSVTLVAYSKIT